MGAGINMFDSTAVVSNELAGNGSGQETLVTRRQWIVHPIGYQFDYVSTANNAPTYAELKTGSLWTRSSNRKAIKIAVLKSNG
jgi:hypothetical protein